MTAITTRQHNSNIKAARARFNAWYQARDPRPAAGSTSKALSVTIISLWTVVTACGALMSAPHTLPVLTSMVDPAYFLFPWAAFIGIDLGGFLVAFVNCLNANRAKADRQVWSLLGAVRAGAIRLGVNVDNHKWLSTKHVPLGYGDMGTLMLVLVGGAGYILNLSHTLTSPTLNAAEIVAGLAGPTLNLLGGHKLAHEISALMGMDAVAHWEARRNRAWADTEMDWISGAAYAQPAISARRLRAETVIIEESRECPSGCGFGENENKSQQQVAAHTRHCKKTRPDLWAQIDAVEVPANGKVMEVNA